MIGINEDVLDKIIKTNSVYLESIEDCKNKLIDSISELEECYEGKDLEKILGHSYKQISNLKKIIQVVESYSEVLKDVKVAYKSQNSNISNFVNRANSKLN